MDMSGHIVTKAVVKKILEEGLSATVCQSHKPNRP